MMKLTGTKVAEAKPTDRERKLSDGGGLYLLVKPNGTKAWRYKYRFNGRELTLAIGLFPEISLKQAGKDIRPLVKCLPTALIPTKTNAIASSQRWMRLATPLAQSPLIGVT